MLKRPHHLWIRLIIVGKWALADRCFNSDMAAESVNLTTKILTKHVYVYILYAYYLLLQKINTLTMILWRIIIWDRYWDTGDNVTCTYTWYIIHLITTAVKSNTCTHTIYVIYLRKMFCGSDNCRLLSELEHGNATWREMLRRNEISVFSLAIKN